MPNAKTPNITQPVTYDLTDDQILEWLTEKPPIVIQQPKQPSNEPPVTVTIQCGQRSQYEMARAAILTAPISKIQCSGKDKLILTFAFGEKLWKRAGKKETFLKHLRENLHRFDKLAQIYPVVNEYPVKDKIKDGQFELVTQHGICCLRVLQQWDAMDIGNKKMRYYRHALAPNSNEWFEPKKSKSGRPEKLKLYFQPSAEEYLERCVNLGIDSLYEAEMPDPSDQNVLPSVEAMPIFLDAPEHASRLHGQAQSVDNAKKMGVDYLRRALHDVQISDMKMQTASLKSTGEQYLQISIPEAQTTGISSVLAARNAVEAALAKYNIKAKCQTVRIKNGVALLVHIQQVVDLGNKRLGQGLSVVSPSSAEILAVDTKTASDSSINTIPLPDLPTHPSWLERTESDMPAFGVAM